MTSVPVPSSPFAGTVIPSEHYAGVSYRLERPLGEGGTAAALFAIRQSAGGEAPVVIKIILPRVVIESGDRAQTIFQKESVALGRLNERVPPTPYVIRLIDTGVLDVDYYQKKLRLPWIALEYVNGGVEGTTLEDRVRYAMEATGHAFEPERAVRVIRALCTGLAEIHAVGVVHRDLTPGNVLCCGADESEMFKISDFGIARPAGLSATFGDVLLGTPGYVAPEQALQREVPVGPYSDVFSLAAVVYFLLTGEHYFVVRTASDVLTVARSSTRKSIRDAAGLSPELRSREASCHAIDLALARATSPVHTERPVDPRHFAASLLPWVSQAPRSRRMSARYVSGQRRIRPTDPMPQIRWTVRHPCGGDRLVASVAWNAAGNALAATSQGLMYWNGTTWLQAPVVGLPAPGGIRCVRRLDDANWLVAGDYATLASYSPEGGSPLEHGPDQRLSFVDFNGDLDDLAVLIGLGASTPPALHALVGSRWLKPLFVEEAMMLTSLARIDDERWLVAGRDRDGRAMAAIYRPLAWELERVAAPNARALLACAGQPDEGSAIAVGTEGAVVRVGKGQARASTMPEQPDLAAAAVDRLGRSWVAAAGRIFVGTAESGWRCVWEDRSWRAPFVSLLAETGFVAAMSVDGGVVECRSSMLAG